MPIYELMLDDDIKMRVAFGEALRLYRSREFAVALCMFDDLSTANQDHVSALYAGRCRKFIASPPPAEWDGVFVAKSK